MGYYELDSRTRLLLRARAINGVKMRIGSEDEAQAMRQMVQEGLFMYSNVMFSEGYWWTPAGEQAAEDAWQRLPIKRFETCHRNHPRVHISLNGRKEESCHVAGPWCSGLWVREIAPGRWLIDHPNGEETVPFKSADEAIEWALSQG